MEKYLHVPGVAGSKRFPLNQPVAVIGRDSANFICFSDIRVSRRHCRLQTEESGRVFLTDLNSANGTFVNGVSITRCELKPGDRILIGDTELIFQSQPTTNGAEALPSNDASKNIGSPQDSHNGGSRHEDTLNRLSDSSAFTKPSHLSDDSKYYARFTDSEANRRIIQVGNDLRFLYHTSLATSRNSNSDRMLDEVLELIFEWIAADRGCVFLLKQANDEGNESELEKKSYRCRANLGEHDFRVSKSIVNYVRKKRIGILSSRAAEDRRWGAQPSILRLNTGEVMCVPIQGREQLLGLIYLDTLVCPGDSEPPRFSEDSLKLLIAMAHQTAVALENESYYAALLEKERLAAIGETTGAIAHHVKNVLQSINGGSHLVDAGLASNDVSTIEKGWQIVARNQQQISQLVADMLLLGGTFEPNLETANLNSVVQAAIKKNRPLIGLPKHEISFKSKAERPSFRFDTLAIESAVGHVIQLCQRASRQSKVSKILVRISDSEENVTIRISDQGMPINIGNSNAILIPLGLDESERVYGIGLAVARKIVNAHGGSIQLTHKKPTGNCFAIELPRS